MGAAEKVALLWLLFAVTHMVFSSIWLRPKLVGVLGDRGFAAAYSVVALVIFVPLTTTYWSHKHSGALFWDLGRSGPLVAVQLGLMAIALCLLVAAFARPSPAAMAMGPKPPSGDGEAAGGIHLVVRHALFAAIAIFGFAHLLMNGFASDVAFFGGFLVFSVVGAMHQDRRKLITLGDSYKAFVDATPFVPLTGGETVRGLRETPWWVWVVGLGLTAALRFYHSPLFS